MGSKVTLLVCAGGLLQGLCRAAGSSPPTCSAEVWGHSQTLPEYSTQKVPERRGCGAARPGFCSPPQRGCLPSPSKKYRTETLQGRTASRLLLRPPGKEILQGPPKPHGQDDS